MERRCLTEAIVRAIRTGETQEITALESADSPEQERNVPPGNISCWKWEVIPMKDENDIVTAMLAIGTNETENASRASAKARLSTSEQLREYSQTLSGMQNAIAREHSMDAMLRVVIESAVSLIGLSSAVVLLLDQDRHVLTPKSPTGIIMDRMPSEVLTSEGGITWEALRTRKPVVFEDTSAGDMPVPILSNGQPAGAVVAMPIYLEDEALGILLGCFEEPHKFTDAEMASTTVFADSVAVAIVHARTYANSIRERRRLEAVLETIPSGAMIIERPDGRVALANRRLAEFFKQDIKIGSPLSHLLKETHFIKPDGTELNLDELPLMRAMLHGERVDGEETTIVLPDGSKVTTIANAAPLYDESDSIYGAVGEFEDVTIMKQAQDMLSQALDKERRISETLQQALLPQIPERIDGLLMAGDYKPAFIEDYVGGDFYDIFCPTPGQVAIVMGDVSGKGISGAVKTALTKYTLRGYAYEDPTPSVVLARLNATICQEIGSESFVTLFYGLLSMGDHTLSYANAGHEPPLHLSCSQCKAFELTDGGAPLGVIPDQRYGDHTLHLKSGDRILLYTDGVTDARNSQGFLGVDGLRKIFIEEDHEPPQEFVGNLIGFLQDFSEGLLRDDVAVLLVCAE
ncbi:MAG: SpoIIE family protein phosphatase [Candidatus Marsarchaeota archaeon]|nr:SpoIIE family protein phosphatase [Candidatus Marsarchaeota archaeon]